MAPKEMDDIVIPESLPMLPVRDVVVFPFMILPLFVGRDSSIRAVNEALARDRLIFLSSQKQISDDNPGPDETVELRFSHKALPKRESKISIRPILSIV